MLSLSRQRDSSAPSIHFEYTRTSMFCVGVAELPRDVGGVGAPWSLVRVQHGLPICVIPTGSSGPSRTAKPARRIVAMKINWRCSVCVVALVSTVLLFGCGG